MNCYRLSQCWLAVLGKLCVLFRLVRELRKALSVARFWHFGASVEDFQVAMIRKEAMALFAGSLPDHAEVHHVLQSLRHSGRREREATSEDRPAHSQGPGRRSRIRGCAEAVLGERIAPRLRGSSDKELRTTEVNNPSSAVASLTAALSVRLTTSMSHSGEQPVRSPPRPPFLTFKAAANPPSLASPPNRRFPLLLLLAT